MAVLDELSKNELEQLNVLTLTHNPSGPTAVRTLTLIDEIDFHAAGLDPQFHFTRNGCPGRCVAPSAICGLLLASINAPALPKLHHQVRGERPDVSRHDFRPLRLTCG